MKRIYHITRIVKEHFEIEATNKKEAGEILAEEGCAPNNIEFIREKIYLEDGKRNETT